MKIIRLKWLAMKKELYEEYLDLKDIRIIWNSLLVDEFNLKWNNINIDGCYR